MKLDAIQEVLANRGVPLAIVANVVSGETDRVGDAGELAVEDLVNALFGDFDCILATDRSLQGQLLPQMWAQGDVECIICRPTSDVLVGVFCKNERGPAEHYRWAKELAREVSAIWAEDSAADSGAIPET